MIRASSFKRTHRLSEPLIYPFLNLSNILKHLINIKVISETFDRGFRALGELLSRRIQKQNVGHFTVKYI